MAVDGVRARVGITDFAQDALGDVVYVELPDVGLDVIARRELRGGRVDEVGVGDLLAGHRHRRRGEPGARSTRPSRSTQIRTARVDLRGRDGRPGRGRRAARRRRVPGARRGGLSHRDAGAWSTDARVRRSTAADQMAAGHGAPREVAAGGTPGAAPLPLGAAGAVARTLPARRRRRRRRLRVASGSTSCGGRPVARALLHGADLTYAVAMPRPEGADGSRRRGLPPCSPARSSPAWPASGSRPPSPARTTGPRRAGVLREPAGRRPAGRRPQAVRLGAGAAGRRGAPARLDPARAASRSTRPTSCVPRTGAALTRARRSAPASPSRSRSSARPPTRGSSADALVEGFRETLDVELHAQGRPQRSTSRCSVDDRTRGSVAAGRGGVPSPAMRCRRCGHQNEAGANFCSSCGEPLPRDEDEATLSLTELADRLELDEELGEASGRAARRAWACSSCAAGPNAGSRFVLDAQRSPRSAATPTPTSSSTTSRSPAATR